MAPSTPAVDGVAIEEVTEDAPPIDCTPMSFLWAAKNNLITYSTLTWIEEKMFMSPGGGMSTNFGDLY